MRLFEDFGFSDPTVEFEVTLPSGNSQEKIMYGLSGNRNPKPLNKKNGASRRYALPYLYKDRWELILVISQASTADVEELALATRVVPLIGS